MTSSCNIAVSPCSTPRLELEPCMQDLAELGYRKFEAFTTWVASAFDIDGDPAFYRDLAAKHQLTFSSMHLPVITANDFDAGVERAVKAAHFAVAIGAPVVLFKASDRATYIRAAEPFLEATANLPVTPVLQNHAGSPISSLSDFAEVVEGIADPRMRTLLEVGHFHMVDIGWREAAEQLGDSIALVHIKDMVGRQSVPFGQGEVDLAGLFAHLAATGYTGDFVIEMEVADSENTLQYLRDALQAVRGFEGVHA